MNSASCWVSGCTSLVFDDCGCGMQIGAEHERVSGGGVDAVRSPGAAFGGVALDVIGGVMRDSDDEFAVLPGNLLEELPAAGIPHRQRQRSWPVFLRGEDVAVTAGMVILTGFTSGLPSRVCHPVRSGKVVRSMASAYWVCRPGRMRNWRRRASAECGYVWGRSHNEGLAVPRLRRKRKLDGNQHRGNRRRNCLRWIVAEKGVSLLADGVAERGRGALRVGSRRTRHEEEERANATAKVADQNVFSPEQQHTCRYRIRGMVAVFMGRAAGQGY